MNMRAQSVLVVGQGPLVMPVMDALGRFEAIKKVQHVLAFDRHLPAADCVIELVGGGEPAFRLAMEALGRGTSLITPNPTLVAAHGRVLKAAAQAQHAYLGITAAGWDRAAADMVSQALHGRIYMGFNSAANALLRRMSFRQETFEQAETQLRAQQLDLSDMGGKITMARAMALLMTAGGEPLKATDVLRVMVDGVAVADRKMLQNWGTEVVYAAEIALGKLAYVGPMAIGFDSPLRAAGERDVLVAIADDAQNQMSRAGKDEQRLVAGMMADMRTFLQGEGRRKEFARQAFYAAEDVYEQVVYCRVPYSRRESILAENVELVAENVQGDGSWMAMIKGGDFKRLRMLAVDGLVLPVAQGWEMPAVGLRLVG